MTTTRLTGLYAMVAAAASLVLAPLLALSYFAIDEGADELQTGTVAAWAEPARELAGGLLTWASPDRVYATYVQAFALLFPAVLLCARAARVQRPAGTSRLERGSWRIALTGYTLSTFALIAASFSLIAGSRAGEILNLVYIGLLLPGMLLSVVGSTVLGLALLRSRSSPRPTAWLLALVLPLMLLGSDLLGHNSLGMVPLFVAWAITGWHLSRADAPQAQGTAIRTGQPRTSG